MGIEVESQTSIPHPKGSGLKAVGSAGYVPENMAQAPAGLSRASFPIGTKVVRGPAWCGGRRMYGDQDGGAGNIGTVIELPPQLATKPEHSTRQWVAVRWLRTDVVATYRAGGTGHARIFDVVPWESHAPPGTDASRMVDLCDAYQRRQISRDEFKAALGDTGCPPGLEDNVIAMVEQKGMCAPAPAQGAQRLDRCGAALRRGSRPLRDRAGDDREDHPRQGGLRGRDRITPRHRQGRAPQAHGLSCSGRWEDSRLRVRGWLKKCKDDDFRRGSCRPGRSNNKPQREAGGTRRRIHTYIHVNASLLTLLSCARPHRMPGAAKTAHTNRVHCRRG
eukprot:COSAG01_NODE_5763_length_4048_cov_1.373259_2_plen_334_part_00